MNSFSLVPSQPILAMPLQTAVSDILSELLIDTAEQLSLKLPTFTEAQFVSSVDICPVLPDELKADHHCVQIISQYQSAEGENPEEREDLGIQLLSCVSEWQADKIEQQSFDTRDAFDNRHFAAAFNQAETYSILQAARRMHNLALLVSSPKVSPSCPSALKYDLEIDLPEEMGRFLNHYYPSTSNKAPVQFYGDFFQKAIGDAELHQLRSVLSPIPVASIYSTISDHMVYVHVGLWHLKSSEMFKFSLSGWDWEEAKNQLQAAEKNETQAIRAVRKIIVTIHQLLAAFSIDLYYLHFYPSYSPQLLKMEYYFTEAGLNAVAVRPYFALLEEIQAKQQEVFHKELKALAPVLAAAAVTTRTADTALETKTIQQPLEWQLVDTLTGHEESVYSVSFSPDGQVLASASHDQTIKLWHLSSRKDFRTLSGHLWVYDVAFSHDGQLLASANGDHTVKLWEVHTCNELKTLDAHAGNVAAVVFVPNTQMVISGSWDYTIKIWNTKTGNRIRTLNGHSSLVNCLAVSPNGHALASGSHDQTIKLWSLKTGQEMINLEGHESSVNTIAFSPNGEMLASASDDRTIKMWSLKTGQVVHSFDGFLSAINSVSFSPDGKFLASAGDDKTIRIWSMESGQTVQTMTGHSDSVYHITFSPDGHTLASSSSDNTIKLWQRK
jgi:WD40 repeat protein